MNTKTKVRNRNRRQNKKLHTGLFSEYVLWIKGEAEEVLIDIPALSDIDFNNLIDQLDNGKEMGKVLEYLITDKHYESHLIFELVGDDHEVVSEHIL